jgi:hypothetical protein
MVADSSGAHAAALPAPKTNDTPRTVSPIASLAVNLIGTQPPSCAAERDGRRHRHKHQSKVVAARSRCAGGDGSEIDASVSVEGKGLFGRVLARATEALLAAGALRLALERLGREVRPALAL